MNRYPGLVDSHLHLLSLESHGSDVDACLSEFFTEGGRWALDVAVNTEGWEKRLSWAAAEPRLWLTAGVHPSEASRVEPGTWDQLRTQLEHPKCVAVGEIGLDWYRGRETEVAQRSLFRDQVSLALEKDLPVVIHNRLADRELLEDLDRCLWTGKGVQHCFSSDLSFARAALDRGFFLSFAGNLTYKSSHGLREVASWAPLDRLLVETDAPYLAPLPFRGQSNRPLWAGTTASTLAELRGLPIEELLQATARNFEDLFFY